jgi:peptidoglycan/LPS O-acetylase OafA/YrhL
VAFNAPGANDDKRRERFDAIPPVSLAPEPRPPFRFETLEMGRGVAATLVVLCHVWQHLVDGPYLATRPPAGVFDVAGCGVEFFFVLSGFIISYVHGGDAGRPAAVGRYAARRCLRIYPTYWILTLGVVLLFGARSESFRDGLDPAVLWTSATLVFNGAAPVIPAAWTLQHEMLFYLVFAAWLVDRRLIVLIYGWGIGSLVYAMLGLRLGAAADFVFSSYHVEFVMGMAAAEIVIRRPVKRPLLLAGAGALGVVLAAAAQVAAADPANAWDNAWEWRLLYGPAFTALIIGFAAAERAGRVRGERALLLLGAASYAIYLVHDHAAVLLLRTVQRTGLAEGLPAGVWFAAVCFGAVAAGVAFHLAIERPLHAALRTLGRRRVPAGI